MRVFLIDRKKREPGLCGIYYSAKKREEKKRIRKEL
jgi:hypothetical protein